MTPHILRHSLVTHLLRAGWDLKQVQEHLRHKSIATTEQYLTTSPRQGATLLRTRHPWQAKAPGTFGRLEAAMGAMSEEMMRLRS